MGEVEVERLFEVRIDRRQQRLHHVVEHVAERDREDHDIDGLLRGGDGGNRLRRAVGDFGFTHDGAVVCQFCVRSNHGSGDRMSRFHPPPSLRGRVRSDSVWTEAPEGGLPPPLATLAPPP